MGERKSRAMLVGLTGGLAMGKSTVRKMVEDEHERECVFDADEAVHSLYTQERGVQAVEREFPGVRATNGQVDRSELARRVFADDNALTRLERVVHPLVAEQRSEFVQQCESAGKQLCFLEVPLLFETGAHKQLDEVVVVTTEDESEQRRRALARPGMTREKVDAILRRQLPDNERCARADHVVNTMQPAERTREHVKTLLGFLKQKAASIARPLRSAE